MQNFKTTSEVDCQTHKLIKLARTVTPCSGGIREAILQSMPQIFLIYETLLTDCLAVVSILFAMVLMHTIFHGWKQMIVLMNNLPSLLVEFDRTIQGHVIDELFINYSTNIW